MRIRLENEKIVLKKKFKILKNNVKPFKPRFLTVKTKPNCLPLAVRFGSNRTVADCYWTAIFYLGKIHGSVYFFVVSKLNIPRVETKC